MDRAKIASGISKGRRTIHHAQLITPHSFKTMNTMARSPTNPMPPDD